jgi:hypothetical protein
MPARRADEAGRPSQPFQVVKTIGIRQEPSLKFPKRLRVVNAGARTSHPLSLRPTPVKWIPRRRLYVPRIQGMAHEERQMVVRCVPQSRLRHGGHDLSPHQSELEEHGPECTPKHAVCVARTFNLHDCHYILAPEIASKCLIHIDAALGKWRFWHFGGELRRAASV